MTPNYLRSPKISVSPYCDCSNSGNSKDDCDKFTEFFTENTCLRKSGCTDRCLCVSSDSFLFVRIPFFVLLLLFETFISSAVLVPPPNWLLASLCLRSSPAVLVLLMLPHWWEMCLPMVVAYVLFFAFVHTHVFPRAPRLRRNKLFHPVRSHNVFN